MSKIQDNPRRAEEVEVTVIEKKDGKEVHRFTSDQFMLVAEVKEGEKEGLAVISHLSMPMGRTMEVAMRAAALAKHVLESTMRNMMSLKDDDEPKEEEDGSRKG